MKNKRSVWQAMVMVTQFSINMLVPIFLCTALGVWLGNRYQMKWLCIPLFFLGAIAGGQNCFRMAKQIYEKQEKKDKCRNRQQSVERFHKEETKSNKE